MSSNVRDVHFLLLAHLHIITPFPSSKTFPLSYPLLIPLQTVSIHTSHWMEGGVHVYYLSGFLFVWFLCPHYQEPHSYGQGNRCLRLSLPWAVPRSRSETCLTVVQSHVLQSRSAGKRKHKVLLPSSTFISCLIFYSGMLFNLKMPVAWTLESKKGKSGSVLKLVLMM